MIFLEFFFTSTVRCDSATKITPDSCHCQGARHRTWEVSWHRNFKTCQAMLRHKETECVCLLSPLSVETHHTILDINAQAITIHQNLPSMLYQEIIKSNNITRKEKVPPAKTRGTARSNRTCTTFALMSSRRLPGDVFLTDVCNFTTSPVSS